MKNGGYGGVLVAKHYEIKKRALDEEAERARSKQWLANYQKRIEEERLRRKDQEMQ